jgi:hypothetical protein
VENPPSFGVNARLLPYLELGVGVKRIARDLSEQLNEHISEATVHQWRSRLRAQHLDLPADASDRRIAETALERGLIWTPIALRHLLPVGHPERRPTRFAID